MLDKQITTYGRILTKIENLSQWDKNELMHPADDADIYRLKRQIVDLGLYKQFFVTQDGLIVGGKSRFKAINDLNTNLFRYDDAEGNTTTIDLRGKFNDVWVTELGFAQIENSNPPKYRATLDGKVEGKVFDSIEQIMIEYSLSDNDQVGIYNKQELAIVTEPYKKLIPLPNYKIEITPSISLKKLVDMPTKKEEPKDKKIVMKLEYTPEQFAALAPTITQAKEKLQVENTSDLFTKMIAITMQNGSTIPTPTDPLPGVQSPNPTGEGEQNATA